MKKFKLCLVALATFFLGAQSVSAATEITSGTSYYIQNVGSGLYLCGANSWGTQGTLSVQGEMFQLDDSDGAYTIKDMALSCDAKFFGTNLFVDSSSNTWTFAAVDGEEGVFTISNSAGYLAQSTTAGYHIGYLAEQVASVTDAAKWYILTKDEAIAKLSAATKDVPVDASFLIGNANFSRNHTTVWSMTASNKNLCGGTTEKSEANACAESWRSTFDLNQSFTGLPNGTYELSAQVALTDYAEKYDGDNYAVLYANNESGYFADMDESDRGTNMATLSASFAKKKDSNGITPIYQVTISTSVTDGKLTIGVKNTRTDTWCIWDNFQLKYYAPDLTKLNTDLANLVTKAETISGKMNATVATTLSNAITDAKNCAQTETALNTAYSNLNNAIDAANASVKIYSPITAIIDKANALDADGQAKFKEEAATQLKAYEDGTITDGTEETTALTEALATATLYQGVGADMTTAIINPSFESGLTGWTQDGTVTLTTQGNKALTGLDGAIYAEAWQPNGTANIYQTIKLLKAGKYELTAHALARGVTSANFYAGETTAPITIVDGQADYSTTFAVDANSEVKIGFTATGTGAGSSWIAFDNFTLKYVSESFGDVTAVEGKMNAEVEAAQTAAIEAYTSNPIVANYNAAVNAVSAAHTSVNEYATAATKLANIKALIESTNVYTEDAYNTYYKEYSEPKAKYDEGTLTSDEIMAINDPTVGAGWHVATSWGDFLTSAWDASSDWSTYYINSWSTEGDNDGSNFSVPFFEYWTGDDASLGDKTLTATMSDLTPGTYNVSAWVRVRLKNSAKDEQATGITFQANEGETVDVCTGTQVGSSQFRLMTVNATGTVGEDGKLEIKFIVADAETNNISWLSFKNVKFELDKSDITETLTYANNGSLCYDYDATVTAGTVYEFTGIYQNQVYGKTVNSITAGKPYIAAGDITLTRAYNAAKVAGGTTDGNGFYGVAGGDADVTGLNNDNLIFYQGDLWHANNSTCSKGHGYFVISEIPTDATVTEGAKALFSLDLDEATGINAINGADANATIYNIAGQRVNNAKSGLFIINGKKVVK